MYKHKRKIYLITGKVILFFLCLFHTCENTCTWVSQKGRSSMTFFFTFYVYEFLLVCVCVCTMCIQCLWRPEDRRWCQILWNWMVMNCWVWAYLEEQPVLLSIGPSLQLLRRTLYDFSFICVFSSSTWGIVFCYFHLFYLW